jgi:hypothetical protein
MEVSGQFQARTALLTLEIALPIEWKVQRAPVTVWTLWKKKNRASTGARTPDCPVSSLLVDALTNYYNKLNNRK